MKRASYKVAIKWIALNDEPEEMDLRFVMCQITVLLLADIFRVTPQKVAEDIIKYRLKEAE